MKGIDDPVIDISNLREVVLIKIAKVSLKILLYFGNLAKEDFSWKVTFLITTISEHGRISFLGNFTVIEEVEGGKKNERDSTRANETILKNLEVVFTFVSEGEDIVREIIDNEEGQKVDSYYRFEGRSLLKLSFLTVTTINRNKRDENLLVISLEKQEKVTHDGIDSEMSFMREKDKDLL